jgi:integrase/recombinase XerD
VTRLRNMMLEELQRRNYSQNTVRAYVRIVRELAAYFRQSPDKLGPDHMRQFQAHLFRERKLNARTVVQYSAALRFLALRRNS